MKSRLRRKKHKQHIGDVRYDASVNDVIARRIVAENGQPVLLTASLVRSSIPWLARDMVRLNLRFTARVVSPDVLPDAEKWISGGGWLVIFEFSPLEFPEIKTWSGNNPDRFR
jgi:hypothetical protein